MNHHFQFIIVKLYYIDTIWIQCSVPNWKTDICTPLRVEKYNLQIKIKKMVHKNSLNNSLLENSILKIFCMKNLFFCLYLSNVSYNL